MITDEALLVQEYFTKKGVHKRWDVYGVEKLDREAQVGVIIHAYIMSRESDMINVDMFRQRKKSRMRSEKNSAHLLPSTSPTKGHFDNDGPTFIS